MLHPPEELLLDAFGQIPSLNLYTQLASIYARPDDTSDAAIIGTLTRGLERLTASFPWIAGQVVNEGASKDNTGVFKIKPYQRLPRLVIKDARNDPAYPTVDALRQAQFPMHMLDESLFAPVHTLPLPEELADAMRVFQLQATFIRGGLVLTSVSAHNTMDMTGHAQLMAWYSQACRNEPFAPADTAAGHSPRHTLIPLLDPSYQPGPELHHQLAPPPPPDASPTPPPPPPPATWAYFTFSAASLAALKTLANQTKTRTTPYITTDDALTSFLWQSITRVRLARLAPAAPTTLARAVDVRRYLALPPTYPGLFQNMTYHSTPTTSLVDTPLGALASSLRKAVDPPTSQLAFATRALATHLHRTPDKSRVSFTATIDPAADVMLSSWAKVDLGARDFGLGLGAPEAVRRPRFVPFEGLVYLMPRGAQGEMAVAVSLREEDMQRLRGDGEFGRYAVFVG